VECRPLAPRAAKGKVFASVDREARDEKGDGGAEVEVELVGGQGDLVDPQHIVAAAGGPDFAEVEADERFRSPTNCYAVLVRAVNRRFSGLSRKSPANAAAINDAGSGTGAVLAPGVKG
jgi:hypothetical protein